MRYSVQPAGPSFQAQVMNVPEVGQEGCLGGKVCAVRV